MFKSTTKTPEHRKMQILFKFTKKTSEHDIVLT